MAEPEALNRPVWRRLRGLGPLSDPWFWTFFTGEICGIVILAIILWLTGHTR